MTFESIPTVYGWQAAAQTVVRSSIPFQRLPFDIVLFGCAPRDHTAITILCPCFNLLVANWINRRRRRRRYKKIKEHESFAGPILLGFDFGLVRNTEAAFLCNGLVCRGALQHRHAVGAYFAPLSRCGEHKTVSLKGPHHRRDLGVSLFVDVANSEISRKASCLEAWCSAGRIYATASCHFECGDFWASVEARKCPCLRYTIQYKVNAPWCFPLVYQCNVLEDAPHSDASNIHHLVVNCYGIVRSTDFPLCYQKSEWIGSVPLASSYITRLLLLFSQLFLINQFCVLCENETQFTR